MWIRIRAVIIEDEPLAAQDPGVTAGRYLQGRSLGSATESESGLRLCAELRPDAVFLDINLPGRDGVSLATQLAMLPQPPRLVFTTGNAGRATDAFRLEAVDYLLKPLDPGQVTEAVNRLVSYLRPFESSSLSGSGDRAVKVLAPDETRVLLAWPTSCSDSPIFLAWAMFLNRVNDVMTANPDQIQGHLQLGIETKQQCSDYPAFGMPTDGPAQDALLAEVVAALRRDRRSWVHTVQEEFADLLSAGLTSCGGEAASHLSRSEDMLVVNLQKAIERLTHYGDRLYRVRLRDRASTRNHGLARLGLSG